MKPLNPILILVILTASALVTSTQSEEPSDFAIVVDINHNPVILNFTRAFYALNESLNSRARIFYNNSTLSESTLSGVAAFIIPPFNKTFSDEELEVIRKYVYRGGILILLALDHDPDREYNMDPIIFDDLLSSLPLEERPKLNYTAGGIGLRCIDPLSNDSFLRVNSSKHFTNALKFNYLRKKEYNLILQTTIFTIKTKDLNETPAVVPPKWVYCLSGSTVLYFESGGVLFYIGKYGQGYVALFGFAISVSDIENVIYQKPWIDLGDNKKFWVDVVLSLLKPAKEKPGTISLELVSVTLIGTGVVIIGLGLLIIQRERKLQPKRKKEISIAEALKQIRKRG
ncbi:MAG: hypothetical protein QXJ52_00345 [Candidatus Korarchaeota archaeon]|nr:hypothetical protein [Thermoproteota archaeon]